jgi:hypothetical protein
MVINEYHGIRYRDLPDPTRYDNPAERIRSGLFFVGAYARALAEQIERMERLDKLYPEALKGYYYIASSADDPTKLEDPFKPRGERVDARIRDTIESMFTLRRMAKTAREIIELDGGFMDGAGESADLRWTTRAIRQVRAVRNSALHEHAVDLYPSAFPMLHKEVPKYLRRAATELGEFMATAQCVVVRAVPTVAANVTHAGQPSTAAKPVPFAFHPQDRDILLAIAVHNRKRIKKADIAGRTDLPKARLLGRRLKALTDAGYLHQVGGRGRRSGYVVTELGEEAITLLAPKHAERPGAPSVRHRAP